MLAASNKKFGEHFDLSEAILQDAVKVIPENDV